MGKKVDPQQLAFVQEVGCSNECDKEIVINNDVKLPCKEWTNEESAMLRTRMLVDNQLMSSGLLRRVERSSLGNSLRVRKHGIDVGPIRTQDSGAHAVNECGVTFDTITMEDFEKTFYVVNTEKNIQICTKKFIGTKWQDMISGTLSEYNAMDFANTDLADLIIADIIEKYTEFLPKFLVMATCNGSGEDMHGDDGYLAKAYYAAQGQYFHTLQFDMEAVDTDYPNIYIQAIVGGDKYSAAPTDFGTSEEYLLDFLDWINTRKEKRDYLFDASIDLDNFQIYVASTFATRRVDLRIILNDGAFVDWKCKQGYTEGLAPVELQKNMMINDVPLLFEYEEIDETNFWQKFKNYYKEFKRYLHRNGFDDIMDSDIYIAIDPELMLERTGQIQNKLIDCCTPTEDISDKVMLGLDRFIPLNALNDTGLFFMTIMGNLLLFDDGENVMNEITNFGRIKITESNCDKPGLVNIYGGVPPVGGDVEVWGAFATNIANSFFVKDNGLDQRGPCENAKLNLICYDDNVKNSCVVEATCQLYCKVETEVSYDGGSDTSTIDVSVTSNQPQGSTLVYDLAYSLSDGTSQTGISSPNFQITLPGDISDTGVILNVTGTIEAQVGGQAQCKANVVYTEKFGEGDGTIYCEHTNTNDNAGNSLTTALSVSYDIDGDTINVPFADNALDYNAPADHAAIEAELEAIFAGSTVDVTDPAANQTEVTIDNVPSFITNIVITSGTTTNSTAAFTRDC